MKGREAVWRIGNEARRGVELEIHVVKERGNDSLIYAGRISRHEQ
jgi:hypothetical protein